MSEWVQRQYESDREGSVDHMTRGLISEDERAQLLRLLQRDETPGPVLNRTQDVVCSSLLLRAYQPPRPMSAREIEKARLLDRKHSCAEPGLAAVATPVRAHVELGEVKVRVESP